MSEKVIEPLIRFKEFNGSWEKSKFKQFIAKAGKKNSANNNFPAYSVSNKLGLIPQNEQFESSRLDSLEKTSYKIVNPKEFAYNPARINVGSIGFNDLDFPVLVSSLYVVVQMSEKLNDDYVLQYIKSPEFLKEVKRNTEGSVREYLFFESLKNVKLPYTNSIKEQIKISSFFKKLDEIIELHQQLLDDYQQLKKVMLQKMFPQTGEEVPQIRFNGYIDAWEQGKFKDVIEKLDGGASIKPIDYQMQGVRTIPKGAINDSGVADLSGSKFISEEFFEKNTPSHVESNNLVTSLRDLVPSAPNMGRVVRIGGIDEKFLMPQGVYKLKLFANIDENFVIAYSNSEKYRKIISAEKNGSTQVHVRNGEFLDIDIPLPSSEEQKKIGSFFKQLDNTIALHQQKLDSYKEFKQAMLQRMFI